MIVITEFDCSLNNHVFSVAQLAKSDVNTNGSILSNYELHLNALDGQCTADVVMKRFIEIITNWDYKSVVGILGKQSFCYLRLIFEKLYNK